LERGKIKVCPTRATINEDEATSATEIIMDWIKKSQKELRDGQKELRKKNQ
jgi:hypothetical protein